MPESDTKFPSSLVFYNKARGILNQELAFLRKAAVFCFLLRLIHTHPNIKQLVFFLLLFVFRFIIFFVLILSSEGENCLQKSVFHTSLYIHLVMGYRKYSAFMISLKPFVDSIQEPIILTDETSRTEMKSDSRRPVEKVPFFARYWFTRHSLAHVHYIVSCSVFH